MRAYLAKLRDDGVVDIRAYAADKPNFSEDCLNMIRTVDVNDACVRLMGARSKEDLIGPTRFRPPHSYRLGAIAALFEGRQMITGKRRSRVSMGGNSSCCSPQSSIGRTG